LEKPEEALVSYKTFNRTARWTAYRQMAVDRAPRQNALAGDAAEREPARIRGATAKPTKECRSAISPLMWVNRTQSGKKSMTKPRDEKNLLNCVHRTPLNCYLVTGV
jgi:hypothetical protein